MITIVINKDNARHYKFVDEFEPYHCDLQGDAGDDWVELTLDNETSTDFFYLANTYHLNLNHIIAVGYEDDTEELSYTLDGTR